MGICLTHYTSMGQCGVFVLVHYFGLANELAWASAFCEEQRALLLRISVIVITRFGNVIAHYGAR